MPQKSFQSKRNQKNRRPPDKSKEKRYIQNKKESCSRTKLMCKECRAIYNGKSWHPFEKLDPRMIDELKMSICPACHEEIDHVSDGILHLSGSGMKKHREEIKHIIMNAAAREEERDILNRVERVEDLGEKMMVYTTKNQLAVEIGKKIASAYKGGKLEIQWSKEDKPVEVHWHFDLK